MSGGIDSSTVAHILTEQGHELIGVRFTLWSDPLAPALAEILPSKCCNAQTAARTRFVAEKLNIPLHIIDLEKEFKENVVDPFLEGYRKGLTPNPCIRCNRTIKFGKLLELVKEFGCEKLATGHYGRVAIETITSIQRGTSNKDLGTKRHLLLEAIDSDKDQSYYLYGLSQEQLQSAIFPLGNMYKKDVFALARHYGIPFDEQYRESQDLCFFPEKEPKEFLKRHLKETLQPGEIVRRDGTVVGTHDGLPLYTLGQRKGLRIGGLKVPLEVVAKDSASNHLIVAEKGAERSASVELKELRWVSWKPPENESVPFEYRTRSLTPKRRGVLRCNDAAALFTFTEPQPPQAPGQSLVLYRGEEVVGGGVIE